LPLSLDAAISFAFHYYHWLSPLSAIIDAIYSFIDLLLIDYFFSLTYLPLLHANTSLLPPIRRFLLLEPLPFSRRRQRFQRFHYFII